MARPETQIHSGRSEFDFLSVLGPIGLRQFPSVLYHYLNCYIFYPMPHVVHYSLPNLEDRKGIRPLKHRALAFPKVHLRPTWPNAE